MAMQVAHEIKNPLTPIKLGAQQLERAWNDEKADFGERLKRHCEVVVQQIDVLAEIAQDFSALAAIGMDALERVDVCAVVHESAAMYRSSNANITWTFEGLDGEHEIQATRSHLLRVFNNLISNAVDAVSEEADPRISLSLNQTSSELEVVVQDNGEGIPEERLEKVFEPRFTSKRSGTGLGLTIAKSIVDQLDGSIEVSSEPGRWRNIPCIFYTILKVMNREKDKFHPILCQIFAIFCTLHASGFRNDWFPVIFKFN